MEIYLLKYGTLLGTQTAQRQQNDSKTQMLSIINLDINDLNNPIKGKV